MTPLPAVGLANDQRPTTKDGFYESTSIGKENLRQVQGHSPQGCGARDLRKLET